MTEHLSSSWGRFYWDNTSNADHVAGMFKMAVNDPTERSFGAITGQIQYDGKLGMTNAGGISQVRANSDLSDGFDTGYKNKDSKRVEGIFHELSEEIRVSLENMCI